jgi:YVTN family beta-propeller protein
VQPRRARLAAAAVVILASGLLGAVCQPGPLNDRPGIGTQLFLGPKSNPVALSGDGALVYALNSPAGTLSVLDAHPPFAVRATIAVGTEPVGLAVRPKVDPGDPQEDELVFVANHVSDSISVVSRAALAVVDVIQTLDANGVSTSDEPTGIAFAGPHRAFVTLDLRNEVLELAEVSPGRFVPGARVLVNAQGPRAIAAAGGRLFVASAESGNQTEFPSCGRNQPASFRRGDPVDEGCVFPMTNGRAVRFATQPNMGGEVIRDTHIPDRDLFVYDLANLAAPPQIVTGVGTLLHGVAVSGSRVFVTNIDARNDRDGLVALGNRMFENRLSFVDCAPACGAVTKIDLEANAFGAPVPVPYGVAASGDGATLVVTAASSDGSTGVPTDPGLAIPGLVTVSATGAVLGRVATGALPDGVALRSDAAGAAETAYVLNSGDATLSVVDVSDPAAPAVVATVPVGVDPGRPEVKRGRVLFSAARASTSGTFACASCHPQGHVDQLLWTINTLEGPVDVPGCQQDTVNCPEPRNTMPVRGLRDTLPLHWVGSLADPLPEVFLPEDEGAPDCDLAVDGEIGCIRHLVDASLAGVMCAQPGCPTGPAGVPGALTGAERDDVAAFLAAVSYPPPPARRPDDALSNGALDGAMDFLVNSSGALLGTSCASPDQGCHAMPLGVATNSSVVGRFDAPTMRGIADRFVLFSNGVFGSEEFLTSEGFGPAAAGFTERASFFATFPGIFSFTYGVPPDDIWTFLNEQTIGLPGIVGRQVVLSPANAGDAQIEARLAQIEGFAADGRITAVARIGASEWRFAQGGWTPPRGRAITRAELRTTGALLGLPVVVVADLPETLSAGGPARQPLVWLPDAGPGNSIPNIPLLSGGSGSFRAFAAYVAPGARVLVDGRLCASCSVAPWDADEIQVQLAAQPLGLRMVQILNPEGFASNEIPVHSN